MSTNQSIRKFCGTITTNQQKVPSATSLNLAFFVVSILVNLLLILAEIIGERCNNYWSKSFIRRITFVSCRSLEVHIYDGKKKRTQRGLVFCCLLDYNLLLILENEKKCTDRKSSNNLSIVKKYEDQDCFYDCEN